MAEQEKPAADEKVTVFMRGSLRGHTEGQRRVVSKELAEWLVANKHARLPKSKR